MQLWINVINNNVFENIESILYSNDKEVANWFIKNLPGEIYEQLSPQYETQVVSAMQIRKNLGGNIFKNIKGFYFGTEQCEYLLPILDETKKAIDLLKQFDKKYTTKDLKRFVFVTPYYGNLEIRKRLIENLDYLNENAKYINPKYGYIEIVVNDFGTLKLLKGYDNLRPILGRLLVKTLKNPLVETFGLEKNIHIPGNMMKNKTKKEINKLKKQLAENQEKGFSKTSLTNKFFLNFMKKYNINRFSLDWQYSIDFQFLQNWWNDEKLNFTLDIYYPYSLIFVGRLCDTSAIENIRRGYYPIDELCPRTCWKYDLFIKNFETVGYKIIQRGNAQYKIQVDLDIPENIKNVYENRLIYQPLI